MQKLNSQVIDSHEENSSFEDTKQLGWNCFDIAAGIDNRQEFVKFALTKKSDLAYRKLLAPEIKHAAALTYINISTHEQSEFHTQNSLASSNAIQADLLPKSMHNSALVKLMGNYLQAQEGMKPAVAECNDKLGYVEGKRLPLKQLDDFFLNENNQLTYSEAYNRFISARNQIYTSHENALQAYCEAEATYESYVTDYYGNNGWFAFQRSFSGEKNTSMVDIAAIFINKVIVIMDNKHQEIYRTQNICEQEITILYNGTNHFSKPEERIQDESTVIKRQVEQSAKTKLNRSAQEAVNKTLDENKDLAVEELFKELSKMEPRYKIFEYEKLSDEKEFKDRSLLPANLNEPKNYKKLKAAINQLHANAFKKNKLNILFGNYIERDYDSIGREIDKLLADDYSQESIDALLVLGDSGTGKSILAMRVLWKAWKLFQWGRPIPIFISLPSLLNDDGQLDKGWFELELKKQLGIRKDHDECLKEYGRWLIILDGYDEVGIQENLIREQALKNSKGEKLYEEGNLYIDGKLQEWGSQTLKLMSTCRLEAIPVEKLRDKSYYNWFGKKNQGATEKDVREVTLYDFDESSIKQYIVNYLRASLRQGEFDETMIQLKAEKYWEVVELIPGLATLAKNPFILSKVIPALPEIKKDYEQEKNKKSEFEYTRAGIYKKIKDSWFQTQAEKIVEKQKITQFFKKGTGTKVIAELLDCYAQNLASFCLKGGKLNNKPISKEKTLDIDLLKARYKHQIGLSKLDRDYLKANVEKKNEIISAIRSGCLLKTCDGQFSFMHKSLAEYFSATELYNEVMGKVEGVYVQLKKEEGRSKSSGNQEHQGFHEQYFYNEPQVLQMLADYVVQDNDFKKTLYKIVEASRYHPYLKKASSNAITILNLAGENFAGKDFQGIRIPYANLSCANFSGANLSEVDAKGVDFSQACLFNTRLQSAILTDVKFGEAPRLGKKGNMFFGFMKGNMVSGCRFSNSGHQLAVAQRTGQLLVYDTDTWNYKAIQIWKMGDMMIVNCVLAYSPDDSYLLMASGTIGTIPQRRLQLYDLQKNRLFQIENILNMNSIELVYLKSPIHYNLAISLDNGFMAVAHRNQATGAFLGVYSLSSRKCLSQKKLITQPSIQKLIFSQDGTQLLVLSDSTVSSYKTPSLEPLFSKTFQGTFFDIAWHNSQWLCAVGNTSSIIVYQENKLIFQQISSPVNCMQFIHAGKQLLVASGDKWRLWNIEQQKCLYTSHLGFEAKKLRVSADEEAVAWIQDDKVSVWSLQDNKTQYLNTYRVNPNCIELSRQGNYLASLSSGEVFSLNCFLQVLEVKGKKEANPNNNCVSKYTAQHPVLMYFENKSMQNTELASADNLYWAKSQDKQVSLYILPGKENWATFNWSQVGNYPDGSKLITLAFSHPSHYLALGIRDGRGNAFPINHCTLQIWDIDNKKLHHVFHRRGIGQSLDSLHLYFIAFNEKIVLCSVVPLKKITFYDVANKQKLLSIRPPNLMTGFVLDIGCATVSPNGQWLVWLDSADALNLYSLKNKKLVYKMQNLIMEKEGRKLFFSQDNQFLYAACDNDQWLWQFRPEFYRCPLQLVATTARPFLDMQYADLTYAIGFPRHYQLLLKNQHAVGKLLNNEAEYIIEKERRNNVEKCYEIPTYPILSMGNHVPYKITKEEGIIYLIFDVKNTHAFLVAEYIDKNGYRHLKKFDLMPKTDNRKYSEIGIQTYDRHGLTKQLAAYRGYSTPILKEDYEKLLNLAYEDYNRETRYYYFHGSNSMLSRFFQQKTYNCFSWCKDILKRVGLLDDFPMLDFNSQKDILARLELLIADNPATQIKGELIAQEDEKHEVNLLVL